LKETVDSDLKVEEAKLEIARGKNEKIKY